MIFFLIRIVWKSKNRRKICKLPEVMKQFGKRILLSYGSGSVLDCSKAIAAGAKYEGDPRDLITYKVKAKAALSRHGACAFGIL